MWAYTSTPPKEGDKAIADLLGHSRIAVTGDIYGYTWDATARAAIDGLSGALGL